MKTRMTLLLAAFLLGACAENDPPSQNTPPSGGTGAAKATDNRSAFEQDYEASSLATCAHAALASGNITAWDDLMASLRARYKVMVPGSVHSQQESDVIKAVFVGKKALEEQGIKGKEALGQWLNEKCF